MGLGEPNRAVGTTVCGGMPGAGGVHGQCEADLVLTRWLGGLSNWQFVAATASVMTFTSAVEICAFLLFTKHVNLRSLITIDVVFTIAFTSTQAWKRWK